MYVVALTGGVGSGKSTVARAFCALGVTEVDADVVARQVVAPGSRGLVALVDCFGAQILTEDGALNRRYLRQLVFSDEHARAQLNAITHPLIRQQMERELRAAAGPYVLWTVPLLVENRLQKRAQRVLVVDVPEAVQIARTINRDGVTKEQALAMLQAQASRAERLAIADDVFDNQLPISTINARVALLHQQYLQLSAQFNANSVQTL